MELAFFAETGGHLDIDNWTITSSRYSDGGALCVDWGGRQFRVGWWDAGDADPGGRTREAITLVPPPLNPSSNPEPDNLTRIATALERIAGALETKKKVGRLNKRK